jgi:nucleoside 2-deoxyribosyltransferase
MSDKTAKQENETNHKERKCFVIMPIGEEGSLIQEKSFGLLDSVIKPVLEMEKVECVAPHEINKTGAITSQAIKGIIDSDIVIANLTGLNPNVMYELGIRHSAAKAVITLAEKGTRLPFDIAGQRNIFYKDSLFGLKDAKKLLRKFLEEIDSEVEDKDNPVYTATQEIVYDKQTNKVDIIEALKKISSKVDNLTAEKSSFVVHPKIPSVTGLGGNYSITGSDEVLMIGKDGKTILKDASNEDAH